MASLSRHHIKYVLGIDIPLNESYQLTESQYKQIIEAQLLYESFLDTVKTFTKDIFDKTITTITNWKDAALVLRRVLSNENTLIGFTDKYFSTFKKQKFFKFTELLDDLGLSSLKNQVIKIIDKITFNLKGWKKFLAGTAIGTIITYIVDNIKNFPKDKLKDWVSQYLSEKALGDILSKLTDVKSYFGYLNGIFKTVDAFYKSLAPTIDRFKNDIKLPPKQSEPEQQPQTETSMKLSTVLNELKVSLDQLMKGVDTEMEHTKKPSEALRIAIDHFKEDPKYYDKLKKAGLEEDEMIRCKNCAHRWKESEGGEDKYFCHKCGTNNMPMENLNEGEFCPQCLAQYIRDHINTLEEAEYKGRKVQLGKPMAGDIKKFKVYVKNAKGNVVKVNFGQKGVKIKKGNPERRKSFRARHHCDTNPGPRWKARYWSCRKW